MKFQKWLDRLLLRAAMVTTSETLIFCECNDSDCLACLPIQEEVYAATRARHPRSAQVLVGHEDDDDEVLERYEKYLVVQSKSVKFGKKR